jgi:phosphate transport system permease protein
MRRGLDRILTWTLSLCALGVFGVMFGLIVVLIVRGAPALSWEFLSTPMKEAGAAGGIFYNIVGTLILVTTALILCAPLATGLALVLGVYLKHSGWQRRCWLLLAIWNGMPSILFGLFGLTLFVHYLGWGKSWLTGGILLGFMMLPTATLSLVERIRALPTRYLVAAAGLGLGTSACIRSVIFPQCRGGLITGLLLGLARVAGETAPILFTATIFSGATIPNGIRESPVLSLTYHLFVLAQDSFDPRADSRMWASALVLVGLVFGFSLGTLPFRVRTRSEAHHA